MKKKTLFNIKGAGRTAIHDRGVRHIARDEVSEKTPLHLTIKVERNKAGLKNKNVLKVLHLAIKKARMIGLRVVHYTLEFDHVHLLVEAENNEILGKGMQSFGICFSKGINKLKVLKGKVFKTRYHLRRLKTPSEVKNVLHYILGNSVKHKTSSFINQYNSLIVIKDFSKLYSGFELMLEDLIDTSDFLSKLQYELQMTLNRPKSYLIRKYI